MLDIYAGSHALKTIQEQGVSQELFTSVLGASGGPKWFSLFGLDKYLFGDFFKERDKALNLIGSSAGSFRFGALAQNNPVEAIKRLAKTYSETVYSKHANANEVTIKAKELLESVYGENGVHEALNNPIFQCHFIVAKCHGLTSSENKLTQFMGLLTSIGLNRINRKLLSKQYQRFVYHHNNSDINISDPYQFKTTYQPLNESNFRQALLASGSIPMVMEGVKNIPGSPTGMYRDGGIIDYHFDISIKNSNGLTLYPHFNSAPKSGWFDKNLSRSVKSAHYDNVVMLVPSRAFIDSLPFQKIPDRKDFTDMDAKTRIPYWKQVLSETDKLAESLNEFIHHQDITLIKPITFAQ